MRLGAPGWLEREREFGVLLRDTAEVGFKLEGKWWWKWHYYNYFIFIFIFI